MSAEVPPLPESMPEINPAEQQERVRRLESSEVMGWRLRESLTVTARPGAA